MTEEEYIESRQPGEWGKVLDGYKEPALSGEKSSLDALGMRMLALAETMRQHAKGLRNPDAYAHKHLQSERDASAHSADFWAGEIEKQIRESQHSHTESSSAAELGRKGQP